MGKHQQYSPNEQIQGTAKTDSPFHGNLFHMSRSHCSSAPLHWMNRRILGSFPPFPRPLSGSSGRFLLRLQNHFILFLLT